MAEENQTPTGGQDSAVQPQRRPYISREDRERMRREALDTLTVGEWREGRVTSVVPFGAFIDLGGIDGLVHISQLGAGGYVEKAEDVVQIGQTVKVRIVEIDKDRQRVGLSMREPNAPRAPRPPAPTPAGGTQPPAAFDTGAEGPGFGGPGARRPDRGPRHRDDYKENRPRSSRRRNDEQGDEEWRSVRGGAARDYYAIFDEDDANEPAPTTPEELVARFNKGRR